MSTKYLFPSWCRYFGWALVFIHIPMMLLRKALLDSGQTAVSNNILSADHLFFVASTLLILIGLFLVAFAKEKIEDEQISQLRLGCLQWAIYVNYFILIMSLFLTTDVDFVDMLRLNLLIPLVFFIIRFRWKMWQLNRMLNREDL